jgi:hypothetical protein
VSNRQHTPPLAAVRSVNTFLMLVDRANKRLMPDVAAQLAQCVIGLEHDGRVELERAARGAVDRDRS